MRIESLNIGDILAGIKKEAIKAANKTADQVVASAKSKCPVGTVERDSANDRQSRTPGTLKASIRKVVLDDKPENIRIYVGSRKAYYAVFVEEYGTVHKPARPFLRPAFNEVKPQIVPNIEAAVSRAPGVKK